jgi:hypothetical protein
MKRLVYVLSAAALLTVGIIACSKEQAINQVQSVSEVENKNRGGMPDNAASVLLITSREAAIAARLDVKFSIPEDMHNEFINSLVFERGFLRGAIAEDVDNLFDDLTSDNFWVQFGFSLRNKTLISNGIIGGNDFASVKIFEGFKPKRGSCVANNRWICVIRERFEN